jgi:hypothetical protein
VRGVLDVELACARCGRWRGGAERRVRLGPAALVDGAGGSVAALRAARRGVRDGRCLTLAMGEVALGPWAGGAAAGARGGVGLTARVEVSAVVAPPFRVPAAGEPWRPGALEAGEEVRRFRGVWSGWWGLGVFRG